MIRWKTAGSLALVVLWASSQSAFAQHQRGHIDKHGRHRQHDRQGEQLKLPLCPVMGDPIDFSKKAMTDDGPVYFCCDSCIKKFTEEPEKYAGKVAVQREELRKMERVQVRCPVTGNPIDGKTFIVFNGKGVYFCCKDCVAKYETNPAKYAAKLEASFTYQTRCPVMGGKVNPTAFADLPSGQRVYFCCKGCDGKFLENPEKYTPKLAAQGVNVDAAKLKSANSQARHDGQRSHEGHDHP